MSPGITPGRREGRAETMEKWHTPPGIEKKKKKKKTDKKHTLMCVCNKMGRFPPGDKETPSSQSQANGKRHPGLNPGVFTRWPCPNRDPRIHRRRAPGGAGSVPGSPRAAAVACVVARPPVRTPTHAHRYTDISRDTWFVTM